MKKQIIYLCCMLISVPALAQKKSKTSAPPPPAPVAEVIPLKTENWDFAPGKVVFTDHNSVPSMKITANSARVVLKNRDFKDGTIEFDMDPLDPAFFSFYFRRKDDKNAECFYFRTARAGFPKATDAIQYAPVIDGVNLWDMLYHYQANADFKTGQWNHVKLVISGKQMKAYVNNMQKPALEIPQLETDVSEGGIAFEGFGILANLVIKPGQTEGLSPAAGIDPSHHDPRYLRNWQVSNAMNTLPKVDFSYEQIPTAETKWEDIEAERMGLINLTRKFGKGDARRIAWLKTNINSSIAQNKKINLGFSDEVWVFVNKKLVYIDKNLYGTQPHKEPDGRCSLENSSFVLPLNAGDNEVLIAVANDFYGWGIVARLINNDEIR